jgi:hypothetical protein
VRRTDRRRCLFKAKNKEGITSVVKKERGRDKIKSIGNGKVPKIRSMGKLVPVNG